MSKRSGFSLATAVWLISTNALAQAVPAAPSAPAPQDHGAEQRVPVVGPSPLAPAPSATPQTPTVPQHTATTETTPPVPPAPSAPPGVIERAATAVSENVRIHGILKPTVTFSTAAVESFGNQNASAITAAANPALANLPNESRLTFQAAQTRFGIWVGEKTPFRAHLEFDFIDFAKSSPTVQALLRLRIASVEYAVTEQLVLAAGQDWDLDAPVNAFGVNLVGTQFQSGNHGFMRQQVKALYTVGSALEIGAAVGLQAANATSKDVISDEIARMPTFALRFTGLLGKAGRLGVSGIITRLRIAPTAALPDDRKPIAGAATLFGDLSPTATTSLRFEGYIGRNLANLGALGLGTASRVNDIDEAGFFVSVRQAFLERNAVYATFGDAHVLNDDKVAPAYTYAPSTPTTATSASSGLGYRWNQSARVGYEFKPTKGLALALDGFWYNTRHVLVASDVGRFHARRDAFGVDAAAVYTF